MKNSPAPQAKPARKKADNRYLVIRDSREKVGHGWWFSESEACRGTEVKALKTGDYTIAGHEDRITIDRKGCVSEFAANLLEERFERELQRMADFELAVVLLEFDFEEFLAWPVGSDIPKARQKRMKLNGRVLLAKFWDLKRKYPHVEFLFAGASGKQAAASLFKRVATKRAN